MSLYGSLPIYNEGVVKNADLVPEFYPGWTLRVYVDGSVPRDTIARQSSRQVEILNVEAKSLGPMYGRFWRFWVAADADVARFIVRDADSLLNSREEAAVAEWIASGKSFHIMCDGISPHAAFDRFLNGDNDRFASEATFPRMQQDYICHDHTANFDDGLPFPPHLPMKGTTFIGERVPPERYSLDGWLELEQARRQLSELLEEKRQLVEDKRRLVIDLRTQEGGRSLRLALAIARALRAIVLGMQFWRRRP